MKKYAKLNNVELGTYSVGLGSNEELYKSMGMELLDVEEGYDGNWYLAGKAPLPPAPTPEAIIKGYENAVQSHLDSTAQSRGYDNTYTCLSYLSSTDEKWKRESNAFNVWRDAVWNKCHEVLNAFMAGEITQPTIEELIAMLPEMDWGDEA